ncbi:glycosyltransferase [Neptuniibacter sp. SY11_33]|uniref:glycosyltransferase n=1 Tax=Neptuniibacter sp. SY11_33 TaxID=3398215 RepID=UPI0039F5986B
MKKITFFVEGFPVLSETFVLNQVASMVESGFDVKIIANVPMKSGLKHPWVSKHDLISKTETVFGGVSKLSKIYSVIIAMILDIFLFNWRRLGWLRKVSVKDYMLARSFENISGPVICHFGPVGARLARLKYLKVVRDVKILTVFHGYDISVKKELEKEKNNYETLFAVGDLMLPISKYWAKRLMTMGCAENKIHVHHMGVDVRDFNFKYRSEISNTISLICVCRFVEKKGIFVLLNALAKLPNKYQLTLVGDGPLKNEIVNLVDKLGIRGRVNLTGPLASGDVSKKLLLADAFVLPSVTAANGDMEGIPVVLMEAMASGLLTFSTNHSGISELISNKKTGFLVEEYNPNELSESLRYAFEKLDYEHRKVIVKKAREKIENDFNLLKLNGDLTSLLHRHFQG